MKKFIKELNSQNIQILKNVELTKMHTYHVKCFAKYLINVASEKELLNAVQLCRKYKIKFFILGKGSNVLFKDKLVKTLIIRLNGGKIKLKNATTIYAFAGVSFHQLIKFCKEKQLTGLEWSAGIPASVGGAIFMNMGAFNFNVCDYISKVTYFHNGEVVTRKITKKDYEYRNTLFKEKNCIIISATFVLKKLNRTDIDEKFSKYLYLKKTTQPLNEYSCGSVFKNGDYFVAKLIQDCNLKGKKIGGAEVSMVHSNFIINKNSATAKDILSLIKYIKKVLQKQYNICIFCEVVIL